MVTDSGQSPETADREFVTSSARVCLSGSCLCVTYTFPIATIGARPPSLSLSFPPLSQPRYPRGPWGWLRAAELIVHSDRRPADWPGAGQCQQTVTVCVCVYIMYALADECMHCGKRKAHYL